VTRIYTNVPSLIAQQNVNQNMLRLSQSLQRLSTGLRINTGADDPAGLIASEVLRSEITGVRQGITNSERANMMIATADSAMNQIANLLNDIRGLISEAANTGVMSAEMIQANQFQVDASLEAIDRIATSTTFMGRHILDGSLSFVTEGVDRATIRNLEIYKMRFGVANEPVHIEVEVREEAERGTLFYEHAVAQSDVMLQISGSRGVDTLPFRKNATAQQMVDAINQISDSTGVMAILGQAATYGQMTISSVGPNNDIIVTATREGEDAGFVTIKFTKGTEEGVFIEYEESLGPGYPATINVRLQTSAWEKASAMAVDTDSLQNNNALDFIANIDGAHFNGTNINFVDGFLTDATFGTNNRTGTPYGPYAYYSDIPVSSTAILGDVNGVGNQFTNLASGDYLSLQAVAGGSQNNNVRIQFVNDTSGTIVPPGTNAAKAVMGVDPANPTQQVMTVYVNGGTTTFETAINAINSEGTFRAALVSAADPTTTTITAADCVGGANAVTGNTQNSGGDAGTLFIVCTPTDSVGAPPGGPGTVTTANDVVNIFNLNNPASFGSERAAAMFTVKNSPDNTGEGELSSRVFTNIFKNGSDGGEIITTAQEVCAALNNNALWGTFIDKATLQGLVDGTIPPKIDPETRIITSQLAPGNHGLTTVSEFQEVAYYGCPYDGTGLQFLGPTGSRDIRFVVDNRHPSELRVDYESIPDQIDYARAILNATNANASVVFTAKKKGDAFNDVDFRIKRAEEPPVRESGWVEYDQGESRAEAQLTFTKTDGTALANSAFFLTAVDRGDEANNVQINMFLDNEIRTSSTSSPPNPITVEYDQDRKMYNIFLNSNAVNGLGTTYLGSPITMKDVIDAINADAAAGGKFTAELSFSQEPNNNGSATLESLGLTTTATTMGNTGQTGGHKGGTVTIYLIGETPSALNPSGAPTANQILDLVNNDDIVGNMFTASNFTSGSTAGTGAIDFIKDTNFTSCGGITERGVLVVHLATDSNGNVITTARDLVEFWDTLTEEQTRGVSVSLLREPGAIWDNCTDTAGNGILSPTPSSEDCSVVTYDDIKWNSWADSLCYYYDSIAEFARGTMVAVNGSTASFTLVARKPGEDYNGYSVTYVNDANVTGNYYKADGMTFNENGPRLELNERTREITIYINEGITTANDVKALIENSSATKSIFTVELGGANAATRGTGLVTVRDNMVPTRGGILPPGYLNGAKLLGGRDQADYGFQLMTTEFGSDQKVQVIATQGFFETRDVYGNVTEFAYGADVDAVLNGVQLVANGWNVKLNTASIELAFTFSDDTTAGTITAFDVVGGGATFQLGPAVTTNQQITIGIPSLNTAVLGGVTGKLFELKTGGDADLSTNTRRAYQIVEESIVQVATFRGRLGALQRCTLNTNINVLNDTLEALSAAESQIRDTDFAEETSNLSRAQVLVQSSINALGIANQSPQYILSLLGR